jgi:DNA-binding NarL/FixJ family response regulator
MTKRRPFASIRILVADDHRRAVLAEVKALIGAASDMIIIGEARDSRTALRLANELKPDVIILDISMLGLSRVKVVERLRAAWPASKILLHILSEDEALCSSSLNSASPAIFSSVLRQTS